jgi:sodium/bile acid cotransporter 7
MKAFLVRRWFLLSLGAVMAVGLLGADFFRPFTDIASVRYAIVVTVLFLMALPLEARTVWHTIRRPAAPALGVLMNSLFLPLVAWLFVATAGEALLGSELSLGLLVAAATPCTLASAAVWTRRAGGNDAASIVVTVVTNASCFLVTPFWLLITTGQQAELDAGDMITSLALVVVLPMTVAQLLRIVAPRVGRWATRQKTPLGVIAQTGVLMMVFIGSVRTGNRFASTDAQSSVLQVLALLVTVTVIHVFVLSVGLAVARLTRLERRDQISVGFAGSQKTQMVGLQVCIELGFNIVPMVAYHVSQLLVDTLIADRLRRRG